MNDLKYIIIQPKGMNEWGQRAIVFNGLFVHADIARWITRKGHGTVVSAGFCVLSRGKVKTVYGGSESLGVESRKQDAAIIERTLNCAHTAHDMLAYDH